MKHLFSIAGEAALAATLARRPLLAFDLDGTLAPIVSRPDNARVPESIARRLDRLVRALPLAIVSGRSVDDMRARLSFAAHLIVGNHGAEDPFAKAPVARAAVFDVLRDRLRIHSRELRVAGVNIEDKQYSIALHYRRARDREVALRLIAGLVSDLGLDAQVYGGKMVVNVVDARAPDKAKAVASLVTRCAARSAIFVGDDLNDEPVLAHAEPSWQTVRVGRDDPNTQAMFVLDSFSEVAEMLDRMLALLDIQTTMPLRDPASFNQHEAAP